MNNLSFTQEAKNTFTLNLASLGLGLGLGLAIQRPIFDLNQNYRVSPSLCQGRAVDLMIANHSEQTVSQYTYKDYLTWPEHERWELIQGSSCKE